MILNQTLTLLITVGIFVIPPELRAPNIGALAIVERNYRDPPPEPEVGVNSDRAKYRNPHQNHRLGVMLLVKDLVR